MIHNASFERPAANPGRGNVQRMLLRFLRGYQEASHRSGQRGSFMGRDKYRQLHPPTNASDNTKWRKPIDLCRIFVYPSLLSFILKIMERTKRYKNRDHSQWLILIEESKWNHCRINNWINNILTRSKFTYRGKSKIFNELRTVLNQSKNLSSREWGKLKFYVTRIGSMRFAYTRSSSKGSRSYKSTNRILET